MRELDEFEVKMKINRLVSNLNEAVLSRNQGPNVPRDMDVATVDLIRVRVSCNVFFWEVQVSRI